MARSTRRSSTLRVSKQSPHFFKVFFPHLSSQNLKIPPKFQKHIEIENRGSNESPETVSLKGPSGNTWYVDLVKNSDGLFFENGWRDFVGDHTLSPGDFLVFRYDGESRFTVFLFDSTACEKEAAFSAAPCQDDVTVLNTSEGEEERNKRIRVSVKRKKGSKPPKVSVKSSGDDRSHPHSRLAEDCLDSQSFATHSKAPRGRPRKKSRIGNENPSGRQRVVDEEQRQKRVFSQRRPVTEAELDRARKMSALFKSAKPFCKVEMRMSYVYYGFFLFFPVSFVRECLPKENRKLTLLDPDGKSWEVTYISYGLRGGLSGGWRKFSRIHNLELGDVCVFELIKKYHFRVHFFRVVENIVPLLRYWEARS